MLKAWHAHMGECDGARITSQDLRDHLAWFRNEYTPRRFNGSKTPLLANSICNIWVILSVFFAWASPESNFADPMGDVMAPKFEDARVEPFSKEQIELLMKAAELWCNTIPGPPKSTLNKRIGARTQRTLGICKFMNA
ncbi:MAG: hypothetical protein HZB51_11820 [Chloroflexi bacterium]|nr:hypothetical protein [Chloroflexota bacterium]